MPPTHSPHQHPPASSSRTAHSAHSTPNPHTHPYPRSAMSHPHSHPHHEPSRHFPRTAIPVTLSNQQQQSKGDVINPRILDASIRDVTERLSNEQKAEVLIHAMNLLKLANPFSHHIVENGVLSCLQAATKLGTPQRVQALLLRGRARLAAGNIQKARQDLHQVLELVPDHAVAKSLLSIPSNATATAKDSRLWSIESASRRLSPELWRQIALFLPRRDLKTLMQIPHVLSRIAFELVFQRVDLHIGICKLAGEERIYSSPAASSPASSGGGGSGGAGSGSGGSGSGWHFHHDHPDRPGYRLEMQLAQRTADIIARIVLDPQFARLIRTVRISAERHDKSQHMSFRSNMLATAIPKLTSLKEVIFTGSNDVWARLADVISQTHPRLESLIIEPEHDSEPVLPHLTHLTSFKCVRDHSTHSLARFLQQNRSTLRKLCLCAYYAAFPPPPTVAFANLTHLEFVGTVPPASPGGGGADVLQHIFAAAHQLESLRLSLVLLAPVSEAFERNQDALPRLRNFGFRALEGGGGFYNAGGAVGSASAGGGQAADPALFPAITEFLRAHPDLVRLELEACGGEAAQKAYGYDASVLGVLPTLTKLRQLAVTVTKDVSPGLFSWILPRGLMALLLSGIPPRRSSSGMGGLSGGGVEGFLGTMKSGMPPGLRYLAILGPVYSTSSSGSGPMILGPAGYDEVAMLQFVKSVVPRSVRLVNVGERFFTVRRRPLGHAHSSVSPSVHGGSPTPSSAGMSPRDTRESRDSRGPDSRDSLGREGGAVEILEEWPERRVLLHAEEWLEALGCEDALWDDFAPESYTSSGFGHGGF